jgi:hypothetical protein
LASEIDIPILLNMKQKLKDNQNLNIIGDLLNQCGQTDKTPILFQRLNHELSKIHHPSEGQMSRQSSKNSCKLNLSKKKQSLSLEIFFLNFHLF